MKKREHLPDFRQLCVPEQNHIANLLSLEIFFFFLCAVGGFLWEVVFTYFQYGFFAKRGFFYGPWLPIYGVGGVLFHLLFAQKNFLPHTQSASTHRPPYFGNYAPRKKLRFLFVFLLSLLLGTGIELVIGWILDRFFHLRYWDYSGYLFNFHGYICLWSAVAFGIAGMLWVCVFSEFFANIWFRISAKKRHNLNTILLLLFVFDCAAAFILPNSGRGITFP